MRTKLSVFGVVLAGVVAALVAVRGVGAGGYAAYRARGGANGFWPWFAKDVCGVALPGVVDKDAAQREQARQDAAKEQKKQERAKKQSRLRERLAKLKAGKNAVSPKTKTAGAATRIQAQTPDAKDAKTKGGKKKVKTGGASLVVGRGGAGGGAEGEGGETYRVKGVKGIMFGSSEHAPEEGVKPLISARTDEDGNQLFKRILWCEDKELEESVYGFDTAFFRHTIETEELSSLMFHKSFPNTEEGMAQALEFYKAMSDEASADLGFSITDKDRTGESAKATVCEFVSTEGDTAIRGSVEAWGTKYLTVTLSVRDEPYTQEATAQSDAVYDAGIVDSVDAYVEDRSLRDFRSRKAQAVGYLQ